MDINKEEVWLRYLLVCLSPFKLDCMVKFYYTKQGDYYGQVAELVYALALGASSCKGLRVRVPPCPPTNASELGKGSE